MRSSSTSPVLRTVLETGLPRSTAFQRRLLPRIAVRWPIQVNRLASTYRDLLRGKRGDVPRVRAREGKLRLRGRKVAVRGG